MKDNHLKDLRARTFVAQLRRFEQTSDPTDLVALFAQGATATRLDARGERTDVTAFWQEYRSQFDRVSTTFFDAVEAPEQICLEWTSAATRPDGHPLDYRGVTVLDLAGDKITALRTYYDSAVFLAVPAETPDGRDA